MQCLVSLKSNVYNVFLLYFQKRTSWVIALFVESQTYSVVPTTWVFQSTDNSGKITIFSKWPPGLDQNVTSEIIKNATIPTQDWSSYNIRLLDNGKEYSKYCFIKYLSKYCKQLNIQIYVARGGVAPQVAGKLFGGLGYLI